MPKRKPAHKKEMPLEHRQRRAKAMKRYIEGASERKLKEMKEKARSPEARLKQARSMDKSMGARYVYVIATSVMPGWYKVGVGNVHERLTQARTWLPGKTRLIAYALCEKPCEVEYMVHERFRNKSEWVKSTPSVLINYMQEVMGGVMTRGRDLRPPHVRSRLPAPHAPTPAPPGTPYPLPPTPGTPSP